MNPHIPLDFQPQQSDVCHQAGREAGRNQIEKADGPGGKNMIIKNTAENKRLVRKLRGIVNAEPGFQATVDST